MAVAADRTEGGIVVEGAGEDSGESEWWVTGVGDGCVEWGIGKRRRYWPGGGRGLFFVRTVQVRYLNLGTVRLEPEVFCRSR